MTMKTSTTATTPVLVKLPSSSAVTVVVVQKERLVSSNRYRGSGFVTLYYIHLMTEEEPPLSCNTLDNEQEKEKQEMNTKCWLKNLLETTFSNKQFQVELTNLTFQCVPFHSYTCSLLASNLGHINLKHNNKMHFIL